MNKELKKSIKKREFVMNIKMFFNNEYLEKFDEQEMNFISSAIVRHCLSELKLSEADCLELSADETFGVSLAKYFSRCTMTLCTIFEVWKNSDSLKKAALERAVDRSTKEFLQPYLDEVGECFEEKIQESLRRESAEIRLEFSTDTNEVLPKYKVFVPPAFIQYILEQLPFVQLDEEVAAVPRHLSELTEQDFEKTQKAPNVRKIKELFEKMVKVGEKLVYLGEPILEEQYAAEELRQKENSRS